MTGKKECPGCDTLASAEYRIIDELRDLLTSITECTVSLKQTAMDFNQLASDVKELNAEFNKLKIDLASKDGEAQAYRRLGITGAAAGGGSFIVWIGQVLGWWGNR